MAKSDPAHDAPQRTWDCIAERAHPWAKPPTEEVWHIARTRGRSIDFVPIRCSPDEGITLPGHIERREPTCPDCMAAVGLVMA